jgi:tetratricopeptide (TPR) repeat protein
MRNYVDAVKDCDKAIQLDPRNANAYNSRGYARLRLRQVDEAFADFSAAISYSDKVALYYRNRAGMYVYRTIPNYEQAIEDYRDAQRIDPEPWVDVEIAKIQWAMGKSLEGLKTIDSAIDGDPTASRAYSMRGIIRQELGQDKAAADDLKKALELDPKNDEALGALGYLLAEAKHFQAAIAQYNAAIELRPNDYVKYSNRGYAYLELGDYKTALQDLLKAINLAPNYAPAHAHLGQVFEKTGKRKDALDELAKAIALNPDYGRSYLYRAQIYVALGDAEKAKADEMEAKKRGLAGVRVVTPLE